MEPSVPTTCTSFAGCGQAVVGVDSTGDGRLDGAAASNGELPEVVLFLGLRRFAYSDGGSRDCASRRQTRGLIPA